MGKETVLALLLREKGHFVSGEAVSAELGITRAAIWKSISALRAQGYEIDAVTGRGYCLKSLPDTLTEQTVRSYLGPVETVGKRIDCFDSIDSTNTYLKRIALDGAPDGTVAVAAEQTSGRGRRGRSFQSAAGKGVYLSILLRPKLAPSQLMPLTGLIAVAMSRAVDRVAGTHSQIKWTNDLILNGRKLCGILTELSVEGETGELQYVVAGIGFNVSQRRRGLEDRNVHPARDGQAHFARGAVRGDDRGARCALYGAQIRRDERVSRRIPPPLRDHRARGAAFVAGYEGKSHGA